MEAYSTEQINRVAELAGYLTPIADIAVLLDVNEDRLRADIANKHTAVSHAYRRAKADISLKLRQQEIELATVGSPLAVSMTANYLTTMESDEDL